MVFIRTQQIGNRHLFQCIIQLLAPISHRACKTTIFRIQIQILMNIDFILYEHQHVVLSSVQKKQNLIQTRYDNAFNRK